MNPDDVDITDISGPEFRDDQNGCTMPDLGDIDLMDLNLDDLVSFIPEVDQLIPMNVDVDDGPYIGQWSHIGQIIKKNIPAINSLLRRYFADFSTYLKFRTHFANEIEHKCWHQIDLTDDLVGSENYLKARAIKQSLLVTVRQRLSDSSIQMLGEDRLNLQEFHDQLERNQQHPFEIVQVFVRMLKREQTIIQTAQSMTIPTSTFPNGHAGSSVPQSAQEGFTMPGRLQMIMRDITELQELRRDATGKLEQMMPDFQNLRIYTGENIRVLDNADLRRITNKEELRRWQALINIRTNLVESRRRLIECHRDRMLRPLQGLLARVRREIAEWHRAQAYAANGKPVESCDIDQLEDCCKPVAELLNASLEQILHLTQLEVDTAVEEPSWRDLLEQMRQQYETLVKEIVAVGLVVEKQPPQVLMKDKKFLCQLRHLVADGLNIHQFRFDTQVWLINTDTAYNIIEGGPKTPIRPSGKILNNVTKSDFVEQTRQLHVHMRNMTLSMRQRGDRGRADAVAEEKYCMVYRAVIRLRFPSKTECDVDAQTMSLPIVVTSHGKQEADAQATIFWDNAFSEAMRRPFDVPDEVQWNWILDGLHWLWKKECENEPGLSHDGIGLSLEARKYLTVKLFGTDAVDPNATVSWRKFNNDKLPNKNFSFWNWFFKVKELVSSNCVKKYWNANLIHGFLSKADCQRMLRVCSPGTFMFRFSDTVLGALSISCYTVCQDSFEVGHLQPDTIRKFQQRSLPDMVKDIQYLYFLYPNTPKDHAFGSYYTPEPSTDGGYWPKVIHVVTKGPHASNAPSVGVASPMGSEFDGAVSPAPSDV